MTPTADQSAAILAAKLRREEPFSFWRWGDGYLELMIKSYGQTCDGEQYGMPLRNRLNTLADCLIAAQDNSVFFGDWQAASFSGPNDPSRMASTWRQFFGDVRPKQFLHPECLLLMRESEALVDFYRAAKDDKRRKLYFGARQNCSAAKRLLDCEVFHVEMHDSRMELAGLDRIDFDVLYFGAGLAGMIPVFKCWQAHPERTYVHLGSALDILGRGKTRRQQLPRATVERMFRGML